MKKFLAIVFIFFTLILWGTKTVHAATENPKPEFLISCGCPDELSQAYTSKGEKCVGDYDTFKADPAKNHFWVEDPEITSQGKADERARQFIYWTVNRSSIDNHPTLTKIWGITRNMSYVFVVLIAAVMGIGIIVSQRMNFGSKVQVSPYIWKLLLILLYITFSASIVILLIQGSEILMKFFIENLGGNKLFNIDFGAVSAEKSYIDFVGCRDLNIRVQEGVHAELMMLKITNIAYYIMARCFSSEKSCYGSFL